MALFYACLRLGAVLVPLNWRLAAPELARVVDDAALSLLVVDERHGALAAQVTGPASSLPTVSLADADDADPAASPTGVPHGAEDSTMILYTSGSTGVPKGAVLPRRQLLFDAIATTVGRRMSSDDVAPVSTPLFHTAGWHVFLTPMLHVGGTAVLFDGFDPDRFLAGLATHGCTVAFGVRTQLAMLRASPWWGAPLPRLRHFISGGAPCPPSVRPAVGDAGYGVRQGYGLTECGPNCFATSDEAADADPDTVGWPVPFLEMRVVQDDGSDAEAGEPGELLLRGPQMFAGYFRDPVRTGDALTSDGLLRTGDLVRRDVAGRFTICGRRKEMFISGGENVFPGEVEAVLCDAPGIAEASGVEARDRVLAGRSADARRSNVMQCRDSATSEPSTCGSIPLRAAHSESSRRGTAGVCSGYHRVLRTEPGTGRMRPASGLDDIASEETGIMAEETELNRLRDPFAPEDIEWRVQTAGEKNGRPWARVLAYVTNRAIMDRLDDVVGPANWQNAYREGPAGGVVCGLSIRVARADGSAEWITKWDGAENSDVEPVKGGLSNSMKRAAVQWGIGRGLYALGDSWAIVSDRGQFSAKTKDGKWFKWDPPALPEAMLSGRQRPASPAQLEAIGRLLSSMSDARLTSAIQQRVSAGLTDVAATDALRYLESVAADKAA